MLRDCWLGRINRLPDRHPQFCVWVLGPPRIPGIPALCGTRYVVLDGVVQMKKQTRKPAWMLLILIQAFMGTCVGLSALSGYEIQTLPDATYVSDIHIGGLNYQEARARLQEYNELLKSKGRIQIAVSQDHYVISYGQINACLDVDKTLDNIFREISGNALKSFIAGSRTQSAYEAAVLFNAGKLAAEAEKFFSQYNREPVPDSYRIENGNLVYSPGADGIRVDYQAVEKRLGAHLQSLSQEVLAIAPDDPEIFTAYAPETGIGEAFRFIVSSSGIALGDTDHAEAEELLDGLSGQLVQPGECLQLSRMLDLENLALEGRQDLINRAATAVYQAFMPIKGITPVNRRPSGIPVPYSDPGLEAVIEGENGDLILENGTGQFLMLLCEIMDNKLHCYVVSPENIPSGVLVALKKNDVEPPEIYTVSADLKKGETRIVSEGREGFTVQVERIIGNDRETLYTDEYAPVSRVIETGESPLRKGSK